MKVIFGQNHGITLKWFCGSFLSNCYTLNCLKLKLTWQQYQEKKYFIFAREKIPLSRPFCNWSTLQCVAPHPSKQRCNKGACICQQEFGHFVKLERPNSYGNWLNIKAWKGTSRLFYSQTQAFIHWHPFFPQIWTLPPGDTIIFESAVDVAIAAGISSSIGRRFGGPIFSDLWPR